MNISSTPEDFQYLKSLISSEDIELHLCCYTDENKTTIETNTLDTQIIKAKDTYDAQNIINRIIFYPNIKKLYLCEIELSQMCIKLLCDCLSKKYCPKLELLDLHESNIDAHSIYYIGSLLESKGITELKTLLLYGNNIGYDGVKILNRSLGCGNLPKLETFNVSGDPDECEELYNHLSHPQCPALSSHIPRSSEIDNMFSKIDPKATTLIDLSVKTYSLEAIHVLLSTCPELPSVAELNLSRCHLSPSSFKYLARFIKAGKLPKLRRLNLSFNDINEHSMMELCDALNDYELPIEIMNLTNCGINSQGIKYLADILEKGKMQFLRLFSLTCIYIIIIIYFIANPIGSQGAVELSRYFASHNALSLHEISIDDCGIGDKGIVALSNAFGKRNCTKLNTLYLQENEFGEEGINALQKELQRGKCPLHVLKLSSIYKYIIINYI